MPSALDNGQRSPKKILAAVERRALCALRGRLAPSATNLQAFGYGPVVVTLIVPFTVSVTTIGLFSSEFWPEHPASKKPPTPSNRRTVTLATSRLATYRA
jgi:hypothetical protein